MNEIDHDFYSLEEAAELFDLSVNDLLKWGGAGKIKHYLWYQCPREEGNSGFVAMPSDTIMTVYLNLDQEYHDVQQVRKSSPASSISLVSTIKFKLSELFVMADELKIITRKDKVTEILLTKILDPNHPWHSENLALAVNAWLELYAERKGNRHDSAYKPFGGNTRLIDEWLEEKNPRIGKTTKEHFRVIINPDKRGGPNKLSE